MGQDSGVLAVKGCLPPNVGGRQKEVSTVI